MSAADGRLHAAATSEGGGRRCKSCHPDHFWKAGRYKLAAPVSKTGSAQTRGRSITDAFRQHFGRRLPAVALAKVGLLPSCAASAGRPFYRAYVLRDTRRSSKPE